MPIEESEKGRALDITPRFAQSFISSMVYLSREKKKQGRIHTNKKFGPHTEGALLVIWLSIPLADCADQALASCEQRAVSIIAHSPGRPKSISKSALHHTIRHCSNTFVGSAICKSTNRDQCLSHSQIFTNCTCSSAYPPSRIRLNP